MPLIECSNCEARVDAKVIATYFAPLSGDDAKAYEYSAVEAQEEGRFDHDSLDPEEPRAVYALLSCPGCSDAMLVYRYDFEAEDDYIRIWPSVRSGHHELPPAIRDSFDEALKCQRVGAFLACVLMCRRVLEAVCRHHYPDVRPLAFGLKKLHDEGIIEKRLFSWAEALRDAGNLSAHDPSAQVSRQDATDLVDFTEAILNYVFVLSKKFERFKERQTHSRQGRSPDQA